MQPLRSARLLARFVLAWFVLIVGAAAAAPLLQGASGLQVICSGGSMQLVDVGDEEGQPSRVATLDCPLCAAVLPPPGPVTMALPPPAGRLQPWAPESHVATPAAPALPARGPPSRFA